MIKAPFVQRDKMLKAARVFVAEKREQEEGRISAALEALGVDWTQGASPKNPHLAMTLSPGPERKLVAGEPVDLELTVENRGTEPIKRLRAWTESDNLFLDRREFAFGSLKPGEKKAWTTQVKLPKEVIARRDEVTVKFYDDQGQLPDSLVSELNFVELPRPSFAFDWQIMDDCAQCNGDGLVQRGERVSLLLDVKNVGTGKALDSIAAIKNVADPNIFIEKGRFKLGEIAPGETKTAKFQLEVKKAYKGDSFPLKMEIIDGMLEEFSTEKLHIAVTEPGLSVESKRMTLRAAEKAEIFDSPIPNAQPFARLPKGGSVSALGKVGGYYKIELEKDRFAFIKQSDAREARAARLISVKDVEYLPFRDPPQISVNADPQQGGIVVNGDRFTLSGTVSNAKTLLDMYVLVNDKKVFFKSASPTEASQARLKFSTEFPLKEGNNYVLVVAREGPDFAGRKALVIRRRPPAVAEKMARP